MRSRKVINTRITTNISLVNQVHEYASSKPAHVHITYPNCNPSAAIMEASLAEPRLLNPRAGEGLVHCLRVSCSLLQEFLQHQSDCRTAMTSRTWHNFHVTVVDSHVSLYRPYGYISRHKHAKFKILNREKPLHGSRACTDTVNLLVTFLRRLITTGNRFTA